MIYLDSASTTRPKNEVVSYVIDVLYSNWYNPSSIYESGMECKRVIEKAREIIAKGINADPEEIIFTPSASAANNLAIKGFLEKNKSYKNFVTTNIEHSSINKLFIDDIAKYVENVDKNGFINPEQFKKYNGCMISVMAANNEIGSIQPIKEIANIVHGNNNIIHCDFTQYIPYYKVDVKELDVDMITFSAHKIGGLKGCGVLYKKNNIELSPLVYGSQEQGLCAGTENIYGIAAMGKAFELMDYDNTNKMQMKRDYLIEKLLEIDGVTLNGSIENRLPNNINIKIDNINIDNQQLLSLLDLEGYQLSSGSACNSYSSAPSYVLKAIGLSDKEADHSIRITISEENSYYELDKFVNDLKNIKTQFSGL